MPDVVRVSPGEVLLVTGLVAIGSQALRIVIAALRSQADRTTSPWRRFRRLGSLVATIGGMAATISATLLALLLIPAFTFGAALGGAFGAALGGPSETHIDGTPLLLFFAVAVLAFFWFIRLTRRLKRRIARAQGEPRQGSREGRIGVAALTTAAVGIWALAVGGVPSWAAAPSVCRVGGFPPFREPLGREAPAGPDGDPAAIAASLGVDLPHRVGGLDTFEVTPTLAGGLALQYVGGTHLRSGQLRDALATSLERAGHRDVAVSTEVPDLGPRLLRHRWSSATGSGTVEVTPCRGTRSPDAVASVVVVGPERLGACAPMERRAACQAMYDAADLVLGEPGPLGPEYLEERGEPPPGPLSSVVDADGVLVLDQPKVNFPSRRHAERRDVLGQLVATGWVWQPEQYDLGNGIIVAQDGTPFDRPLGEVTFRRVVGGIGLTLVVDVDVFGATLRITTDRLG